MARKKKPSTPSGKKAVVAKDTKMSATKMSASKMPPSLKKAKKQGKMPGGPAGY